MCLVLCQYHTVLSTIAFQYTLKHQKYTLMFLTLFFFLKIILPIEDFCGPIQNLQFILFLLNMPLEFGTFCSESVNDVLLGF